MRIKSIGIYREDDARLLGAFTNKAKATQFQDELDIKSFIVYYYHTYASQLEVLGYSQARDLEVIIESATKWRSSNE